MQKPMLIVVSGPDRVGKSTLISQMAKELGNDVMVLHHGAPPSDQSNIFDFYRQDIEKWKASGKQVAIFDRAWPCSFILEQHRRRNAGHFEDVIDLEIEINDMGIGVVHVGQFRPWHWSAPLHIEELREEFPDAAPWYIRDEYNARMQEHKIYTEQLINFYEDVTMFPNVQFYNTPTGAQAIEMCRQTLRKAGT